MADGVDLASVDDFPIPTRMTEDASRRPPHSFCQKNLAVCQQSGDGSGGSQRKEKFREFKYDSTDGPDGKEFV